MKWPQEGYPAVEIGWLLWPKSDRLLALPFGFRKNNIAIVATGRLNGRSPLLSLRAALA